MSKRIQIILQDTTMSILDRVAKKGTRSRCIDQAVRHFAESKGSKSLRNQLKAAYKANAKRDLAIAEGMEDIRKGHVRGPFNTVREMIDSMKGRKYRTIRKAS